MPTFEQANVLFLEIIFTVYKVRNVTYRRSMFYALFIDYISDILSFQTYYDRSCIIYVNFSSVTNSLYFISKELFLS